MSTFSWYLYENFLVYMFYYYVLFSNFKMYGQKRKGPNWKNVAAVAINSFLSLEK